MRNKLIFSFINNKNDNKVTGKTKSSSSQSEMSSPPKRKSSVSPSSASDHPLQRTSESSKESKSTKDTVQKSIISSAWLQPGGSIVMRAERFLKSRHFLETVENSSGVVSRTHSSDEVPALFGNDIRLSVLPFICDIPKPLQMVRGEFYNCLR